MKSEREQGGADGKQNVQEFIPPHGGYRNLKSLQVAEMVYDITVRFCERYVPKTSRTHDF